MSLADVSQCRAASDAVITSLVSAQVALAEVRRVQPGPAQLLLAEILASEISSVLISTRHLMAAQSRTDRMDQR